MRRREHAVNFRLCPPEGSICAGGNAGISTASPGAGSCVERAGDPYRGRTPAIPSVGFRHSGGATRAQDINPQLWSRRRGHHAVMGMRRNGGRAGGQIRPSRVRCDRLWSKRLIHCPAAAATWCHGQHLLEGYAAAHDIEHSRRFLGADDGLRPGGSRCRGLLPDYVRASRLAFRAFQDLAGDYYGIRWLPTYAVSTSGRHMFSSGGFPDAVLELFKEPRDLKDVDNPFPGFTTHRVWSMLIEPPVYLNALLRDFLLEGGKLTIRDFADAASLNDLREPAIVNCTGLGARELFGDKELIPVKGQLAFLVPQPEVTYCTTGPAGIYMFPRRDGVLLGGTHERDVWTTETDEATINRIVDEHQRLFTAMRLAQGT